MTRSLTRNDLVSATSEELLTYLRSGTLNTHALARSLDYDGLDIADWDRLKRIHFCLTDDVQEFVADLSERLRRIKTESQHEHVSTNGEVRGSIDWSATLRTWSDTGYADRSRFICDTPYTEYDIAENRVLKRLLWQIHRTVTTDLRDIDYDWRREYWSDDRIDAFSRRYRQNVHLNRIGDGKQITVTGNDLNTARQSRLRLYTEAYELYDTYQRLQSDTLDPDIAALLADTLVVPSATPTLYELFCVFRLIRLLNSHVPGIELQPIDGQTKALARLETTDHRIEVYHDQTGNIDFREKLDPNIEPDHATFKRYQDALLDYTDTLESLTGTDQDPVLYSGRPDIIVETYDTRGSEDDLTSLLIGEIKFSKKAQTFRRGLQELVTYRKFARDGTDYLESDSAVSITPLLITNGYDTEGAADRLIHTSGRELLQSKSERNQLLVDQFRDLQLSLA